MYTGMLIYFFITKKHILLLQFLSDTWFEINCYSLILYIKLINIVNIFYYYFLFCQLHFLSLTNCNQIDSNVVNFIKMPHEK